MGIIAKLMGTAKAHREKEIERLYEAYKRPFISFILSNFGLDREEACDLYQESFADMCSNVRSGQYTEGAATLKTYLFEIGKRKACNHLRAANRMPTDEQVLLSEWLSAQESAAPDWVQAQQIATRLVQETEDICRRVLTYFYWERLPMTEIAARMNYKDADVAKNKKSSCLRRFSHELQRRLEAADIHWKRKEKK